MYIAKTITSIYILRKFVQLTHKVAPSSKKPPPDSLSKEQQPPMVNSLPRMAGLVVQPSKHCNLGGICAQASMTNPVRTPATISKGPSAEAMFHITYSDIWHKVIDRYYPA